MDGKDFFGNFTEHAATKDIPLSASAHNFWLSARHATDEGGQSVDQSSWSRVLRWLFNPMRWSIAKRRLFLLFLPVSFPTWAAVVAFCVAMLTLEGVLHPVRTYWTAPPRRRARYGQYGYYRSEQRATARRTPVRSGLKTAE